MLPSSYIFLEVFVIIKAIRYTVNQHIRYFERIVSIAWVHMKKKTAITSFGMGWVAFHDIVYFAGFSIFRLLLAGGKNVEEDCTVHTLRAEPHGSGLA